MWWYVKFVLLIVLPLEETLLGIYDGIRDGLRPVYLLGLVGMAFVLGVGCKHYLEQFSTCRPRQHDEALRRAAKEECGKIGCAAIARDHRRPRSAADEACTQDWD